MIGPRLPGFCEPCAVALKFQATGMFDNQLGGPNDLNLPPFTPIPQAPARVDSNPVLVAGFNSFMFVAVVGGSATFISVFVIHCDPFTGADIVAQTIGSFNPAALGNQFAYFGAFSGTFVGQSWNTIKIGLQGFDAADGGIGSGTGSPSLWCRAC